MILEEGAGFFSANNSIIYSGMRGGSYAETDGGREAGGTVFGNSDYRCV